MHIEKVCKISSAIVALKRIRSFITTNYKTAVQVYFALIQPHFDYCCSVWDGLGETFSTKIGNYKTERLGSLLDRALTPMENLYVRRRKLKAQLIFKTPKGNMPSYLRTLFSIRNTKYNFRNNQFKLNLPKPRTNYLKRSLSYDGALLWNSLPEEIRSLTVFPHFKKAINDYYPYLYR